MLYPQSNPYRQLTSLNGFWDFRTDPQDAGLTAGWSSGFESGQPIAVPASWNDQFTGLRDYLGPAWYQTHFELPWGWQDNHVFVRFGSVNYQADVWLNGVHLGEHEGGHLPFEFEISSLLQVEGNRLVVRVDSSLAPDRVPPGNVRPDPLNTFSNINFPPATFDFFPFCGIHRPVLLYAVSPQALTDLTVSTRLDGSSAVLSVNLEHPDGLQARAVLCGHGSSLEVDCSSGATEIVVPNAALWTPGTPNLYDLIITLFNGSQAVDRYTLPVGLRTIVVQGENLLLNGQPIYLKGFGRHEDFPVTGRGLVEAVIIKDYALLQWVGANSFRTTHYPYSEQMMDLADRLVFLVIDETPAVGLFFAEQGLSRRLKVCKDYVREIIDRDKNHPSVIMWSLANEPHSRPAASAPFFRELYDLARSLDATRPITLVSQMGLDEASFEFLDVLCLNRYYGWYTQSGQIEDGLVQLAAEIDAMHLRFGKPLILTEFGADTLPGQHALPPEMFSEEYQAEFILRTIALLRERPFVVGEHVWNLCDFKTAQAVHRTAAMNYKGVFTRDRRPKLAAHKLRELWGGKETL